VLAGFLHSASGAAPPTEGRKLADLNVISPRVLKRSVSPKFFQSLLVSPVQGWIVVRGSLAGTRLSGARVVHSELNGAYDSLALKLADELTIAGYYSIEKPRSGASVLVHLLVYQIADGTMTLSFPTFDEPGGDQMEYWGCARLAVLKGDGKWTEIKGPESLQGKGWAVRQGAKNHFMNAMRMEMKLLHWD
jgi:hypothetical protein